MKSGNLNVLEPSEPLQVCNGTDSPFTFYYITIKSVFYPLLWHLLTPLKRVWMYFLMRAQKEKKI